MRKIFKSAALTACAVLTAALSAAANVWAADMTLSAENVTVGPTDSSVSVSVMLSDNPGICSLGFDVEYDTEVLALKNVSYGNIFDEGDATPGDIKKVPYTVSFSRLSNVGENGELAVLDFDIINSKEGEYAVKLSKGDLGGAFDIDEREHNAIYKNGLIAIGSDEDNAKKTFSDIGQRLSDNEKSENGSGTVSAAVRKKSAGDDNTETADAAAENETDTKTEEKLDVRVTIGEKNVVINGTGFLMDAAPYIQRSSSSTLVPLRFVSAALSGGDVEAADKNDNILWHPETKTAEISAYNKTVCFTAGSDAMVIDGKSCVMEYGVKAEITENRMFIPFRALGNALGFDVDWDADTGTAIYTK